MSILLDLQDIDDGQADRVGGKALALGRMLRHGITVPRGVCVTTDAYDRYVGLTGLRERILLEINRKDFREMRWEEMWDASLRIRNMFVTTPIPPDLIESLQPRLTRQFADNPVVVRSSAPGEDASQTSFAGLHESYVNVRGADEILDRIRLVWASLWSDAALLYRQELSLDVEASRMAVVVQELVSGDSSGVAFCRNPTDDSQAVIEAVHGLNQGLVDGTVEPDRWILERDSGRVVSHRPANRREAMVPVGDGVELRLLPEAQASQPPLADPQVSEVYDMARRCEALFGSAQDVEWTMANGTLTVLQSRAITTPGAGEGDADRRWYLSLRRSFDNLRALRTKIEGKLIPQMIEEADRLGHIDPAPFEDGRLADEIQARRDVHQKWLDVYWDEFIPFAHGARLFGQVYNDTMRPADPYQFVDLLRGTEMVSLERNRRLEDLAGQLRTHPQLAERAKLGALDPEAPFMRDLRAFLDDFGDRSGGAAVEERQRERLVSLLLEMSRRAPGKPDARKKSTESLVEEFLSRFQGEERARAVELLELARASYRLRDDDNIHLGRIEAHLHAATDEGRARLAGRGMTGIRSLTPENVASALRDPSFVPEQPAEGVRQQRQYRLKPRQLTGQPAGPGIASGTARVVRNRNDLFDFKVDEVLVCDAIDPNMTFVAPLAAAIVERRGGMLIHGAIIAREYGRPCVTGVPDAVDLIRTGDRVTVDGYLGIVVVIPQDPQSAPTRH